MMNKINDIFKNLIFAQFYKGNGWLVDIEQKTTEVMLSAVALWFENSPFILNFILFLIHVFTGSTV